MTVNYSLTEGPDGRLWLHAIDCPAVEHRRKLGEPVLTMLDCRKAPSSDLPKHSCLEEKKDD